MMKICIIVLLLFGATILAASCQSDDELEFNRYYSSGMLNYQNKCQNCHGAKGEGLSALIPPLTDSVYLKNNKGQLACIIKYGLSGKITVANKTFDDKMPAVDDAAAVHIAELLTYINNSFGNKLGVVTTQQVGLDLQKCK